MSAAPSARVVGDLRLAIIVSRFHPKITERLLSGAQRVLTDAQIGPEALRALHVPGAFEIPVVAKCLAESGAFDGVLCLGCVIRGETLHYDLICRECAHGIQQVALTTGIPVIFGVITAETPLQAEDRAGGKLGNVGEQGAHTLLEMVQVMRSIASV